MYKYTATGRYYKTYLDGVYQTQHTTEREAIEESNRLATENPDSDVTYKHEYEVSVIVQSPAGGNAVLGDVDPPLAPAGLTLNIGVLSWADNSEPDIDRYNIYKSTVSSTSGFLLEDSSATSSWTDTAFNPSIQQWYKITAVDNANNESGFSAVVFNTPGSAAISSLSTIVTQTSISVDVFLLSGVALTEACTVEYRAGGVGAWSQAAPGVRVRTDWASNSLSTALGDRFGAMVFFLSPGTSYEIRATVGGDTASTTVSTRATPRLEPVSPTTVNVSNTAGLASAASSPSPGTVITLANGTYDASALNFDSIGTYDNPIIVRGNDRDSVVLQHSTSKFSGDTPDCGGGAYWIFENLTLENTQDTNGCIRLTNSQNTTIRKCRLKGTVQGWHTGSAVNANWSIYDNIIEGPHTWAEILTAMAADNTSNLWGPEGLSEIQGYGHEIYQNTVSGFGDCLGVSNPYQFTIDGTLSQMNRGIVFHNNLVLWGGDDAIEFDDAFSHCAAYQNTVINTGNLYSVQPNVINGGPRYCFQNIALNQHGGNAGPGSTDTMLKLKTSASGSNTVQVGYFVSNTIVRTIGDNGSWLNVTQWSGDQHSNFIHVDNVYYATQAHSNGLQFMDIGGTWQWIDHNAYGAASGPQAMNVQGDTTSTVAAYAALGNTTVGPAGVSKPLEQNSVAVTASDLSLPSLPSNWQTLASPGDVTPTVGSSLRNQGGHIAQLSGSDIGARDYGTTAPVYGNQYDPNESGTLFDEASTLTEGQVKNFTSTSGESDLQMAWPVWALDANGSPEGIHQWGNEFHYSPAERKAYMFGKGAGGTSATHSVYDEATSTWSVVSTDLFGGSRGHVYGSYAWNASTQQQWYHDWGGSGGSSPSQSIQTVAGTGSWSNTGINPAVSFDSTAGLAYHPNLYGAGVPGFVWCDAFGIRLQALDGSSTLSSQTGMGSFSFHAVYNPVLGAVICGGAGNADGNGSTSTKCFIVVDSSTIQEIDSYPVYSAADGGGAMLLNSPYDDGVMYLVQRDGGSNYYTLKLTSPNYSESWVSRGSHGMTLGNEVLGCTVNASNYPCLWFMQNNLGAFNSVHCRTHLWRPPQV